MLHSRDDRPRTHAADAADDRFDDSPFGAVRGAAGKVRPGANVDRAKAVYWLLLFTSIAALGYRSPISSSAVLQTGEIAIAAAEIETAYGPEPAPVFTRQFLGSRPDAPSVHASTIARLPDGGLIAAWFGGSREGAKDVSIYASNWSAAGRTWEPPRVLIDRSQASRELGRYIKKLGNPVLHCGSSGRLWLYYVTVSVGGWSGGSISVKSSDDQGRTWSDSRRLITTPFLNTSNLVRATPIGLNDGGVLLPAYHEFLYQFGELLHLDAEGRLVQKYRMNSGSDSLQPALLPRSATELLAFHRRGGKSQPAVLVNRSTDAGQSWSDIRATNLPNPNASVGVVRTHVGKMLMALNPSESNREQLAIATSADGEDWQVLEVLERGEPGQEFSYPSLIRGEPGVYHLSYTWNRERICHVTFNDAWLEAAR